MEMQSNRVISGTVRSDHDDLMQQLRQREMSRQCGDASEIVTYDTGQKIERRVLDVATSKSMRAAGCAEKMPILETRTEDARSGMFHRSTPLGGSGGYIGEKTWYPELHSLIEPFDRLARESRLLLTTPAICELPAVLAGHGNIPPWAVLNIWMMRDIFLGTVFPFERHHGYRISGAREHFEKSGQLLDPALVTPEYDGMVACVRGGEPEHDSRVSDLPSEIEFIIFNPKMLAQTTGTGRPQQVIPSLENSLFEVRYLCDRHGGERPAYMSLRATGYSARDFFPDKLKNVETIEESLRDGFYFKVEPDLAELIVRLAPLPIELSDCGASLGYPRLNEEFTQLRMSTAQRRILQGERQKRMLEPPSCVDGADI